MDLAVVFSSVNAAILVVLLSIYLGIVLRTRSAYPAGMMIFASFLLVQNLLTAYSYVAMNGFFAAAVLPYLVTISLFEFGGLIALTRITL